MAADHRMEEDVGVEQAEVGAEIAHRGAAQRKRLLAFAVDDRVVEAGGADEEAVILALDLQFGGDALLGGHRIPLLEVQIAIVIIG